VADSGSDAVELWLVNAASGETEGTLLVKARVSFALAPDEDADLRDEAVRLAQSAAAALTTISSHPSLELAPGGDHATKARSKGETGSGSSTLGASLANP